MPINEDTGGDSNAPRQPTQPTLSPSIQRTANRDTEGSKNESAKIQYCKEKPDHWGKTTEAICAILLVCITGYYAYFAKQRWIETQKTANAAICATRISADALKLSRQEFASSQAAVLQPNVLIRDAGKGPFVQIDIINSGHIAATRQRRDHPYSPSPITLYKHYR